MNKASCLSLLSNAVLVWNTVRISEIVDRLRAAGEQILDTDLAPYRPSATPTSFPMGHTILRARSRGDNPAHNTLP